MVKISEVLNTFPQNEITNLEKEFYKVLDHLKISFERVENDSVHTMEECIEVSKKLGTEIRKSIFLRNNKGTSFFLIVLPANKSLDVDKLSKMIKIPKLSFATEEDMEKHLNQKVGSISIAGLIYDKDDYVQVFIDKEITEEEYFGCNPGVNTAHLKIKTNDLLTKYLPYIRHKAKIIDL